MWGRHTERWLLASILATLSSCTAREPHPSARAAPRAHPEPVSKAPVPAAVLTETGTRAKDPDASEPATEASIPREDADFTAPQAFPAGRLARFTMRFRPWELPLKEPNRVAPRSFGFWASRLRIWVGRPRLTFAEISPDGRWVTALSEADGVLHRYSSKTGYPLGDFPLPDFDEDAANDVSLWPVPGERPRLLHVSRHGHRLIDLETGTVGESIPSPGEIARASRDGRAVGSVHVPQGGSASRFELYLASPELSFAPALTLDLRDHLGDWELTRRHDLLVALYPETRKIDVLDLKQRRVLHVLDAPPGARSIALSPDDRYLAVGGRSLRVYDLESASQTAENDEFGGPIHQVRFSPSGDVLVATSHDGRVRSFQFKDEGTLGHLQVLRHQRVANVYAVSFSADGRLMATSSGDRTVKIWERWPRASTSESSNLH